MKIENSDNHLLYQQGREAMENQDIAGALVKLKKSAQLFPHFKTYESIGECLLKQDNYSEAVIYLAAAAGLGNKPSRAYFLLALALLKLKDVDNARSKLNLALSINPNYKEARELLSTIC